MFKNTEHIHFIGIGGIGMSGIAEVLINLGFKVSGSDLKEGETTKRLVSLGADIACGHRRENIKDADVVVISSAVKEDNPEVMEAHRRLVPVIPRAEMLAELMRLKRGVAIAGTHGKTTTTSMVSTILSGAGIDPTVVIGGKLNSIGSNAKLGQGEYLVAEADESDGSFLYLSPTLSVVTNIDPEHLDHYGSMEEVMKAYLYFINKVPFYGLSVLCIDNKNIQRLLPSIRKPFVTYGMTPQATFQATDIVFDGMNASFTVKEKGVELGRLSIGMPGMHNVYNALAAVAVSTSIDIDFDTIRSGMEGFCGIQRRFQLKGEHGGISVIDDYGHHPTEIKATLSAAKKGWDRRVVAVFQPHRYSRTKELFEDFVTAFNEADLLILTDIYAAGEKAIEGVTGRHLFEEVVKHGHRDVSYVADVADVPALLHDKTRRGDMVITMGAGNVNSSGEQFLQELKESSPLKIVSRGTK